MSEKGEGTPQISEAILPDISEHAKLAEAAKREYQSIGSIIGLREFPKDALDTIYLWWGADYPKSKAVIDRLQAVASKEELPSLEKRDILNQLKEAKGEVEPIVTEIVELLGMERVKSDKLWEITRIITEVGQEEDWREKDNAQAIAVGEALVETTADNLDPREIRIRIAQGAWEEVLNAFTYYKLHYAAETEAEVTTQDSIAEEKTELIASLRRKPWGIRQLQKNRKVYSGLRKQIIANEYDEQILDDLKLVWDAARGAVPSDKSALNILFANEQVLTGLAREGALDWDLEELEEEGEEEEEET